MLEVKGLRVGYDDMVIVQDAGLSVEQGEIITILGPNGSGKTTLLRAVVGVIADYGGKIYDGNVVYKGETINGKKPFDLLKKGIAFVPDGGKVFPSMTVKENLEMGGFILDDRKIVTGRIEEILHLFPILKELMPRKAAGLSGGERQILALARSLITEPETLILDEPTVGLSPGYRKIVFEKLKELKNSMAIMVVEQNARLSLEYSDRGYIMKQGRITLEGSGKELLENNEVFKLL